MPSPSPAQLDRMFQALADPCRRGFVEQLARGPASVTSLAASVEVGLPAVLKHLRILENGGILVSEKTGRVRTYRLRPEAFEAANRWIQQREREMHGAFDRLATIMAELPQAKDC